MTPTRTFAGDDDDYADYDDGGEDGVGGVPVIIIRTRGGGNGNSGGRFPGFLFPSFFRGPVLADEGQVCVCVCVLFTMLTFILVL